MKKPCLLFLITIVSGVLFSACKHDMFDPDAYQEILTEASPFSDVDPRHTWNLTESHATLVMANVADAMEVSLVRILSDNPFVADDAEILAEAACSKDQSTTLFYYAPACQQALYAALITVDGRWLLKKFDASQREVSFAADVLHPSGEAKAVYQTYTYCYEDNYPEPGDNDFNDIVLRVQKLPAVGDNEIRLRVTLAAVGTLRPVAAAICLTGYDYDDVESVSTVEGRVFDPDYSLSRYFIETSDLLLRGINGQAVLNLFEDAHYVMYPTVNTSSDGSSGVVRRYYNTSQTVDGVTSKQSAPRSLTYVIKLRNPRLLQNFTLEDIDPFIMKDFNSGKWEIHTFAHKADQVLHDLGVNSTATSSIMVWALKIPYAAFRYPQEETSIGYFKDGILTGAYMTLDHSFGQWVTDRTSSLDWFHYPSVGMVY